MTLRGLLPSLRTGAPRLLLAMLALGVLLTVLALPRIQRAFLIQSGERGHATLRLAVEGLQGALRRYEPLPGLIAERPLLLELLADPLNPRLVGLVNESFRQTANRLEASDVYLMDLDGLTLAASSYRKELSFVGRHFGFRPYFTEARDGRVGRYFALGTTSGERGYFFAAPVWKGGQVQGVVAVKFTVDGFEANWRGGGSEIILRDTRDIIFMASRPDWHFRTLAPLSAQALARIEQDRQYPIERLKVLENDIQPLAGLLSLMQIADLPGQGDGGARTQFVVSTLDLPEAGWRVSILTPAAQAKTEALAVFAILLLLVLFLALSAAIVLQRRARMVERLEAQRATSDLLEKRVSERTTDLNRTNRRLIEEVEERRTAEAQLRKAQADLVQAGKLAALGQMSAALSHEFNQPLAAVKSYAENAGAYLDRGRIDEARTNIGHISAMADRMAAISKHLRNFARRPQERSGPVQLDLVLADALALMESRLKGVEVQVDQPEQPVWVLGGHVRLQQVIVNLLSNALDAMEGLARRRISINLTDQGARVRLEVRDTGTGLDEAALAQIFDPFFSTKRPGKGLGLGLSISYNIVKDFGGHLRARNHPEGGAVFEVDLSATAAPELAAE